MAKDWKGGNASIFKTIGASNHSDHERGDADFYATEPAATDWLCKIEQFKGPILEPSCGEGHISRQLIAHGYEVVSRDLVDRGYGEVADFLFFNNEQWRGGYSHKPTLRSRTGICRTVAQHDTTGAKSGHVPETYIS